MMQQKACLLESRRAFLWLERAIVYWKAVHRAVYTEQLLQAVVPDVTVAILSSASLMRSWTNTQVTYIFHYRPLIRRQEMKSHWTFAVEWLQLQNRNWFMNRTWTKYYWSCCRACSINSVSTEINKWSSTGTPFQGIFSLYKVDYYRLLLICYSTCWFTLPFL